MADIFGSGNQKDARIGPIEVPTSLGTLLTLAEPLFLKNVMLANRTAIPQTVILHIVPVGDTASNATQVIPGVTVPPNDSLPAYGFGPDGIPMLANEKLQHIASGVGINIIVVMSRRNR